MTMTHCGNPAQKDKKLKEHTGYKDTCLLFELRDEGFYDDPNKIKNDR